MTNINEKVCPSTEETDGISKISTKKITLMILFSIFISAKAENGDNIKVFWSSELLPESPLWYTKPPDSSEIKYKLDRQQDLHWSKISRSSDIRIIIDPEIQYQSVLGIGTSLEATSLYAIRKGRSETEIRKILELLLDPQHGLGFNLFRITIGTSDFSDGRSVSDHPKGFYTYQDNAEDEFSIQADKETGIIAMLKLTQDVAANMDPPQQIKFFAVPWSPPAWMKTSGKLIGGTLKKGYEKQLAKYLRYFVEAYALEGIPIHAVCVQNEPNYLPRDYPGMKLTVKQQLELTIATYEEFHDTRDGKSELFTKIWLNDHNFEYWVNADYILSKLKKSGKGHYVSGTAFHNYSDYSATEMSILYEKHPESEIVFTEHSEWGTAGMFNIQQYFWNWSRSYMYWVTMTTHDLDEHNQGPYNVLGELSPTLLIEKESNPVQWYVTPEFYLIGQFSKFIRPGAYRIACDQGSIDEVTFVAFKNTDGIIVLVGVNQTDEQKIRVLPQAFLQNVLVLIFGCINEIFT